MASSPSSIHFGHYIAGIASDLVGKFNALLANEQLATGMAPQRWRKTLNMMLEKLAGNDNIKNFGSSCYSKPISITTTSGWDVQ